MASSLNHVENDVSHSSDDNDDSDVPSLHQMRNVREVALLKKIRRLTCHNTKKIPLKCDPFGKPIGAYSTLFERYVGYLARDRISIAYKNWKLVPKQKKFNVYDDLMGTFDIPSDRMDKKMILSNINTKWKTFKTTLGSMMKDEKTREYLVDPPKQYPYVDQDAWNSFVQHRCTKDFQDLSKANRERSKKKEHSYRASSMGYARLAEKILIAKKMDPETTTVSRADLWKAARCDGDGTFADERTSKMAYKIDVIQEQISKGIITLAGREDTLSLALGKDEHPGRLRGVGSGIGVKRYFGPNNRAVPSSQRERILESRLDEVLQRVTALEKQLNLKSQGSMPEPQVSQPLANEEQVHQSPKNKSASSMIDFDTPTPKPWASQQLVPYKKRKKSRVQ